MNTWAYSHRWTNCVPLVGNTEPSKTKHNESVYEVSMKIVEFCVCKASFTL